jgi:hypothetical protein
MRARALTLALSLLALALLTAAPAGAVYEPLASGQTKLSFEKSFLAALKSEGIALAAVAPAQLQANTVSFPIASGKLDPRTENGTLQHEGALLFQAQGKSIPLKDLQLKTTQKRSPLSAKVGGSQLKIATARGLGASRAGFGEQISVSGLTLSAKLATRLAKKLGARGVFAAGMALGRSASRANPETIAIQQKNKAELTLAPSFQAKLDSLFVALNPVFPVEHPGPFTLPLAAGQIAPDATTGTIETEGALEFLQLGGGQVFWREAWIDLGARTFAPEAELLPSPPYAGKLERASVASLLPTSSVANAKARSVAVAGTLLLDAATAAAFNEVFAKPLGKSGVFVAGEAVGGLGFTAVGQ